MDATPSIKAQDGRWIRLNESPSVNATDEWLLELGCQKNTVGKTVQGRDITLYWMDYYYYEPYYAAPAKYLRNSWQYPSDYSVLFLSLVHGNEPLGLVSLLMGAKELASSSAEAYNSNSENNSYGIKAVLSTMRIYFLPIVNVDAYELSLERGGGLPIHISRPNLRRSCGVDLNRNFPMDWMKSPTQPCSYSYSGPYPLSEPETQAIAAVVDDYKITHAMSLHTLGHKDRGKSLLIHPFTSDRKFETMNRIDATRFREWSETMNRNVDYYYVTGTAQEAINYTAGGTTIDWMYSEKKIVPFVLEVLPSCSSRWCLGNEVYQAAAPNVATMKQFVLLAATMVDGEGYQMKHAMLLVLLVVLLSGIIYSIVMRRHNWRLFLYRFWLPFFSKRKKDAIEQEEKVEMVTQWNNSNSNSNSNNNTIAII